MKSDEKKKKKKSRRHGEPLVNVNSVVSKVQTFSKAITNPFSQSPHVRFSEEDTDDESSSSQDSKDSPTHPVKKSTSAEQIKSKSLQLRPPTLQLKPEKKPKEKEKEKETKKTLSLKTARPPRIILKKAPNSDEQLKERKKAQNRERKLREDVAKLTNELGDLQAYNETHTLLQSVNSVAEELKMLEGIFKGARHAVRDQFRESADEVQRDKQHNWEQMNKLEAMLGKEIEAQKKLNKELDSIIARLHQEQENKKNGSKKNSFRDFVITIVIIVIFVVLLAAVLYKRFNNR